MAYGSYLSTNFYCFSSFKVPKGKGHSSVEKRKEGRGKREKRRGGGEEGREEKRGVQDKGKKGMYVKVQTVLGD